MTRTAALAPLMLLASCGEANAPADRADPRPDGRRHIAAPIRPTVDRRAASPAINSTAEQRSKPLVSRETSTPMSAGEPDYRAIGTEPFWAVSVNGATAILERPDRAPIRASVVREQDSKSVRYQGNGFSIMVTEGPCSDGISDVVWSDRVQVAFVDGTLKGCGGVRLDMREDGL